MCRLLCCLMVSILFHLLCPAVSLQPTPPPPLRRHVPPGEGSSAAEREARSQRARAVFDRGFRAIREGAPDAKEEAVMLLEAWRDFEAKCSEFRWVDGVVGLWWGLGG